MLSVACVIAIQGSQVQFPAQLHNFNPSPSEPGAVFANSVDPDQLASKKPTDLELHCLPILYVNLYQQSGSKSLIG